MLQSPALQYSWVLLSNFLLLVRLESSDSESRNTSFTTSYTYFHLSISYQEYREVLKFSFDFYFLTLLPTH